MKKGSNGVSFFFLNKMWNNKCKRNDENRKSLFGNYQNNHCFRQKPSVDAKLLGESLSFLRSHRVNLHEVLSNYKRAVGRSGRQHFNQVMKVSITNNWTNWQHVPLDRMHWEEHNIPSVDFLPNVHTLNLIMKKQQTNPTDSPLPKLLTCRLQNERQRMTEEMFQMKGD